MRAGDLVFAFVGMEVATVGGMVVHIATEGLVEPEAFVYLY